MSSQSVPALPPSSLCLDARHKWISLQLLQLEHLAEGDRILYSKPTKHELPCLHAATGHQMVSEQHQPLAAVLEHAHPNWPMALKTTCMRLEQMRYLC